jgi:uncharacterized protein (DUF362 family)
MKTSKRTTRREFLKTSTGVICALPVIRRNATASQRDIDKAKDNYDPGVHLVRDGLEIAKKGKKNNIAPVLREEIIDNPQAVFIIQTKVTSQKDGDGKFPPESEQFQQAGYETAHSIYRQGTIHGGTTYIKPNFVGGFDADKRNLNNGISTHPSFVIGFCKALNELGNTNIIVGANGAATHQNFVESGICKMMDEHRLYFTEGKYKSWHDYTKSEIAWFDCPDGMVMKKIPFFRLTKEKDTTFINMAKERIHILGCTTLTIKNLQGIMPVGYMHICGGWPSTLDRGGNLKGVFNPNYRREVEQLYIKHARMNFKHWDEGGWASEYFNAGGWDAYQKETFRPDQRIFWGEQWGQRMMDISSTITPAISMVEGIVGIDGDNSLYLNNFIVISKSMVACDSVASWMMGHDSRELPYLRIANERGLGQNDIEKIPIFEIKNNKIERVCDYRKLFRAHMGVRLYGLKGTPLRFF